MAEEHTDGDIDKKTVDFVEKKIFEARALSSENLIWWLIGLAGLFGVLIPIFLSFNLNSRVDTAIEKMEARFEKLSNSLNPRPDIRLYVNGISLDGYRFSCDSVNNVVRCQIVNEGHATARSVRILLMTNIEADNLENVAGLGSWYSGYPSDPEEVGYKKMLYMSYGMAQELKLDMTEAKPLDIVIPVTNMTAGEYQNMFKVYCENEQPKRFKFTIIIRRGMK